MLYKVYFEIFDKKMQYLVNADSKSDAENIIRNKIIFHKIYEQEDTNSLGNVVNEFGLDALKNLFGML